MQTKETMMRVKPFAITLDVGTSLANRTGSWRTLKPVYVDRLPPCNAKCPAGEQCQAWLFHKNLIIQNDGDQAGFCA